jgi:hypothetical protein
MLGWKIVNTIWGNAFCLNTSWTMPLFLFFTHKQCIICEWIVVCTQQWCHVFPRNLYPAGCESRSSALDAMRCPLRHATRAKIGGHSIALYIHEHSLRTVSHNENKVPFRIWEILGWLIDMNERRLWYGGEIVIELFPGGKIYGKWYITDLCGNK